MKKAYLKSITKFAAKRLLSYLIGILLLTLLMFVFVSANADVVCQIGRLG